jgi:LacI family transcriptional regulator
MAKLTIRDIARLAGVSKSTVSLVLNGSSRVDPTTRDHVLDVIKQHGYVPNAAATSLAGGGSRFLGMIVPSLSWTFVANFNHGVASIVEPSGYEIVLYTSLDEHDYSSVAGRIRGSQLHGGLIVVSSAQDLGPIEELHRDGTPVVLVATLANASTMPTLVVDNAAGARGAVEHLLDLGHRRIGQVAGPRQHPCCRDRSAGYRSALRAAGLKPDPALTVRGGLDGTGVRPKVKDMLSTAHRPTAVFAHTDYAAFEVMAAAEDCGLRVPEDLSVVGFDDIESASHVRPALTTVRQPFHELGERAAQLLLTAVEGSADVGEPIREEIQPELVVRDSSVPPKHRQP